MKEKVWKYADQSGGVGWWDERKVWRCIKVEVVQVQATVIHCFFFLMYMASIVLLSKLSPDTGTGGQWRPCTSRRRGNQWRLDCGLHLLPVWSPLIDPTWTTSTLIHLHTFLSYHYPTPPLWSTFTPFLSCHHPTPYLNMLPTVFFSHSTDKGLHGQNKLIKSCSCYVIPLERWRIRPSVEYGMCDNYIGTLALLQYFTESVYRYHTCM